MLFPLNSLFLCCSSQELALLAENWKVYGGVVSLKRLPEPYLVEKIILSENYNSVTNDQDIALLKLTKPVVFDGQSQLHFMKIIFIFIQKHGTMPTMEMFQLVLSSAFSLSRGRCHTSNLIGPTLCVCMCLFVWSRPSSASLSASLWPGVSPRNRMLDLWFWHHWGRVR